MAGNPGSAWDRRRRQWIVSAGISRWRSGDIEVTVNTVSPGMSDGGLMVQTSEEFQEAIREWSESGWTPTGRLGRLVNIADVCALLCSDEARFLTGHALSVDGGSSLMSPDFPLALQLPDPVELANV